MRSGEMGSSPLADISLRGVYNMTFKEHQGEKAMPYRETIQVIQFGTTLVH